jgi:hypothetical protein
MLLRTSATALYKPVVETTYSLFPQSTNKLDPLVCWVSTDPIGVAQLWAGIPRNNRARLEIIGRGHDCDDLLESMKDLSLTEAKIALENGTGDVELHWKKREISAQFSVKDGPVTRYVWWDVVAVDVVGA